MDLGLTGKAVLVAAASKGLGKASALQFAKEGANVTIASRNIEQLQQAQADILTATGQQVRIVQLDVRDLEQVEAAVQAATVDGKLDVLVTNAGGPKGGVFEQMDDADWQAAFELNLLSVIRMIRIAIPYMRQAGGGRIVNLTSTSIKQPIEGLILSSIFRAGVQALTKSLASELASDRILINTVAPGRIATDRIIELDQLRANEMQTTLEAVQTAALQHIPLGRMGSPEEFANIVAFYGSYANSYVTGQSVLVDGGMVKAL